MMNLISHNGFILVEPILEEEVTASGIIIPKETSATDEQIAKGKVVVGTEKIKVGTVILFDKLIPSDIWIETEGKRVQYFALNEAEIMFSE